MSTNLRLARPVLAFCALIAVPLAARGAESPPTSAATPPAAPADVAAPPADAERSASGLAWKVLAPGHGNQRPGPTAKVKVQYTGWTTDGAIFDSSAGRGPAVLPLDRVIAGWREGVGLMVAGEKRRFWVPEELAYAGRAGAPAGMLVFDVELLEVIEPPPAPADVAAPPADAQTTASGLAWKSLREGSGTDRPGRGSLVEVHYTGWTTDGKMFDSSLSRGTPAKFRLDQVIPGWTEGLQLMVEGESRRFWIPQKLAYRGRPGMPAGMLVFDVELLRIVNK